MTHQVVLSFPAIRSQGVHISLHGMLLSSLATSSIVRVIVESAANSELRVDSGCIEEQPGTTKCRAGTGVKAS